MKQQNYLACHKALSKDPGRQTIGAVYSDGSKALPEAMDKILEDCDCLGWGLGSLCSPTCFFGVQTSGRTTGHQWLLAIGFLPVHKLQCLLHRRPYCGAQLGGGFWVRCCWLHFGPAKMHVRSKPGDLYYPVIYMRIIISLSHCNDPYAPISTWNVGFWTSLTWSGGRFTLGMSWKWVTWKWCWLKMRTSHSTA